MGSHPEFDDEQFAELLTDFLDESFQLLALLNQRLLFFEELLQEQKIDQVDISGHLSLINEVFRAAHSIKGASSMLGLQSISMLTHRLENVLERIRSGKQVLGLAILEILFKGLDSLERLLERLRIEPPAPLSESDEQFIRWFEKAAIDCISGIALPSIAPAASPEVTAPASLEDTPVVRVPGDEAAAKSADRLEASQTTGVGDLSGFDVRKYLQLYLDETDEELASLNHAMLRLEQSPRDPDAINEVFRMAHRIKGSSTAMGFDDVGAMAHHIESLFEDVRAGKRTLSQALHNLIFRCLDGLRDYHVALRSGEKPPTNLAILTADVIAALQSSTQGEEEPLKAPASVAPAAKQYPSKEFPQGAKGVRLVIDFESGVTFPELKAELILTRLSALGNILSSEPPLSDLESARSYRFVVYLSSEADESSIRRIADIDGVKTLEIRRFDKTESAGAPPAATAPASPNARDGNLPPKAGQGKVMSANSTAKREEKRPAQVSTKESVNRPAGSASFVSESGVPKVAETMRVEIERLDHLMNLAGELVINKSRFVQIAGGMHDLFRSKDSLFAAKDFADHLDNLSRQLVVGAGQSRSGDSSEHLSDVIQRLREDYRAVEGEIEKLHHARRQFDAMTEAIHQLTRVAEGIQKSVMDTRMAPVEPLFTRFKRVVRDVAQGAGKEVTLVISGEKTELDKRMIDELGDPLIHMVRNAVDHGLETPAEREAVGKPRAGTVRLEAMHRGNSVMILVSDDGRGIDSTRVLKKAIENGLVSESDSLLLTERQILNFIWHPGLSTAAKITDISGRGVGMDIVKSKIDELNGSVEVRTEPGAGSTFTIRLPLTMAILPSLLVRIYDEVYAMPLENVEEIVNVSAAEIYSVRGKRTIKVRDGVLTLIQLDDIFRWSGGGHPNAAPEMAPSDSKKQDLTVVILVSSETRIGLVVDHLIGEDDIVIKSLTENFVNVRGLSGASILGDGRVSLILDVSTLVDMVVHPDAARLSA